MGSVYDNASVTVMTGRVLRRCAVITLVAVLALIELKRGFTCF